MPLDIFKGCPEFHKYRPDQRRDRRGRFAYEGRGRARGASTTQRFDDAYLGLVQSKGAGEPASAIRNVMGRLPDSHRELLRRVPKMAVVDMRRYATFLGMESYLQETNAAKLAFAYGFFNPMIGVVLGKGFTNDKFGFLKFDEQEKSAAHELGHAFDFYSTPGTTYGLSASLAGVLLSEYNNLSGAQKYFSQHYTPEKLPRELFAEVYSAMYGGKTHGKNYVGYSLTQQGVLRRFPRTVAAIRAWNPS